MYQGKFNQGGRQASEAPVAPREPQEAPRRSVPKKQKRRKRRGSPTVTAVFYTLYFLMIAAFAGGTFYGLNWLFGWLTDYEAAQPTVKCQQVFDRLYSDPDWQELYVASGLPENDIVNRQTYAAYMEQLVGDGKLSYLETSAGLTGNHKYIVSCGDIRVGTFSLADRSGAKTVTDIPDWRLDSVTIEYDCHESVRVETAGDTTVYINGEPMDDSTILSRTAEAAELDGYLPDGVSGPKTCVRQVTGLLVQPEVTAKNADGKDVKLSYSKKTGTYRQKIKESEIPDAEKEAALNAAHTFCLWMIERINSDADIAKHFDRNTDVFRRICSMRESRWMQGNAGYKFEGETVTDYRSYTKSLSSARVKLSLNVTRKDGTVKEYEFEQTILLQKQEGGWIAIEMTNTDLSQVRREVHLIFRDGDTVLQDEYYRDDIDHLTVPVPEAPEGKVFSGWAVEEWDGTRNVQRVVFQPDAEGNVSGFGELDGMVLHSLYEDA